MPRYLWAFYPLIKASRYWKRLPAGGGQISTAFNRETGAVGFLAQPRIGKGVTEIVDVEQMAEHLGSRAVFRSQDWATGSTNSGVGRRPLQH